MVTCPTSLKAVGLYSYRGADRDGSYCDSGAGIEWIMDYCKQPVSVFNIEAKGNITEFYWNFNKTVTGKNIGIIIPKLRNPGEIAGRISFFAPVSLLFFFVVMIIISLLI